MRISDWSSDVCSSDLVMLRRIIERPYFGEGIVNWDDRIVSLTWRHRQGFVWKLADFAPAGDFRYEGEGWGLTQDGDRKSVVSGKSVSVRVDPGGRRIIKKKKKTRK